jgi:hypothetical protein
MHRSSAYAHESDDAKCELVVSNHPIDETRSIKANERNNNTQTVIELFLFASDTRVLLYVKHYCQHVSGQKRPATHRTGVHITRIKSELCTLAV